MPDDNQPADAPKPTHPPLPPAENPLEQAQKDGAEQREENPGYQ